MKILLEDINAKIWREDIFKQTVRNESLCEINNNNGVSKLCHTRKSAKSTVFPHS